MYEIDDKIGNNIGLIRSMLGKFKLTTEPDAESACYEALHRAILSYDEDKGIAFSTYASTCIYNALCGYLRTLKAKRQLEVVSYNDTAYTDDEGAHEHIDFIADTVDIQAIVDRKELHKKVNCTLAAVLASYTNVKHRRVVEMWLASDCTMSMSAIGKEIGISQSYVSTTINNFKSRMRDKLEVYDE